MPRLGHSPSINGAFTHNGVDYPIRDGIIEVEDEDVAREMAEHRRLELLEIDETPAPEGGETTFYCGVNDCGRKVDNPEDVCWQHQ